MNFLARLMSHGFALSLVVLLAIGFIYRGELFPEWELPAFLVFDSDKDTSDDQLAAKIEPAPVKDDLIGSDTATSAQQASDIKEDAAGTDAAEGMLPLKDVTEAEVTAITAGDSAAVEAAEAIEKIGVEMPASPAMDTAAPRGAEDTPVSDEAAALKAGVAEKSAMSAPEAAGLKQATTAIVDAGVSPEDLSAGVADSKPQLATVAKDSALEPAAEVASEAAVAPVIASMDKAVAQTKTGAATEVVTAESQATASGLSDAPVAAAVEATVAAPTAAPAGSAVEDATGTADSATSSYQVLALAREAYWMRDYQAAEDYYHQLILLDPDDPDGYGELANLYFSQGNWEEAASAYYEAGSRLVKSGLLEPARGLVDVIRGLKGPQADVLEDEIEAAQASSQ